MFYFLVFAFSLFLYEPNSYAATYYVAKTGSNSNSCTQAQSQSSPKVTIAGGIGCLAPADTLMIGAGSYSEGINGNNIPSGSSWANTTKIIGAGMANTKLLPSGVHGINFTTTKQYIELSDFEIDATKADNNGVYFDSASHHIRFTRLNIHHAPNQGFFSTAAATDLEIIESEIHQIGWTGCFKQGGYCHGIYSTSNRLLIDRSILHHNNGFGIHIYPGPAVGVIVRNSISHSNLGPGLLFTNSANSGKIINNTFYNNGFGGPFSFPHIQMFGNQNQVQNNIAYLQSGQPIENKGSGNTLSNNLTTNPNFVNAGASDFYPQSTSPAINAGIALSEVPTDFGGVTRPQGLAFDIGAYEYVGSSSPQLNAPSNLQVNAN